MDKSKFNWCIVQLPDGRMATTSVPTGIKEGDFLYTELNKFIGSIGDIKVKLVKIMFSDLDPVPELITDPPKNGKCYERDEIILNYLPEFNELVHSIGIPFEYNPSGFKLILLATTGRISTDLNSFTVRTFNDGVDIKLGDMLTPGVVIGIGKYIHHENKEEVVKNFYGRLLTDDSYRTSFISDFESELDSSDFSIKKSRYGDHLVTRLSDRVSNVLTKRYLNNLKK